MLSTRDTHQNKGHMQTESEGLAGKTFHSNGDHKKAGVAIFISDKRDFKIKVVKRDKEGHYIMFKRSIQGDITIISIYAPNIGKGNGNQLQYSCLENPMDGGAW